MLIGEDVSTVYVLFFSLYNRLNIWYKLNVEILCDIQIEKIQHELEIMMESETISWIERGTWNKLKKYTKGIISIYICNDFFTTSIPFALMQMNEYNCWGGHYQIFYCNTVKNVKNDVFIDGFSNSVFFCISAFDREYDDSDEITEYIPDLGYARIEVEKLCKITGGEGIYNKMDESDWSRMRNKDIVHIATHTIKKDNVEGFALILGQNEKREFLLLGNKDRDKLDLTGVKLVVLSACNTNVPSYLRVERDSLSEMFIHAGARCCISTVTEVADGTNAFFMICFYKYLLQNDEIYDVINGYLQKNLDFCWSKQKINKVLDKLENDLDVIEVVDGILYVKDKIHFT